jgi:hypothetical protein
LRKKLDLERDVNLSDYVINLWPPLQCLLKTQHYHNIFCILAD